MKKRSLAISLLALASLSLASCHSIDDAAEKELARSIVAGFKTTDKVGYRATVTGSIKGDLWNSDNNDEVNLVEGSIGTSYVQWQEFENSKSWKDDGTTDGSGETDGTDGGDTEGDGSEGETDGQESLKIALDESEEDSSTDTDSDSDSDGEEDETTTGSATVSGDNPYTDAKNAESSACLRVPTLITPESFDTAYDGMIDGSLYGALANNTDGVLQCKATEDGGIEFYVENFSNYLNIYGIGTGKYGVPPFEYGFREDRPFQVYSRWNISVIYGDDGVIKEEKIQNVHSHTDDPEANVTLNVTYEVY